MVHIILKIYLIKGIYADLITDQEYQERNVRAILIYYSFIAPILNSSIEFKKCLYLLIDTTCLIHHRGCENIGHSSEFNLQGKKEVG